MTEKKRHILIITSWYPSEERPTYGSFVEEQAKLLLKKGNKVTVLQAELSGTFIQSFGKPRKTSKSELYNNVHVVRIKTTPVLPKARRLSYNYLFKTCLKVLKEKLDNELPNLIHSHAMFMGGVTAEYIFKQTEIPFLHTEHTSGLITHPVQYTKSDVRLIQQAFHNASFSIFVSSFFEKKISQHYGSIANSKVIPNMVRKGFFESIMMKSKEATTFLCIGNFISVKNHHLLLKAWRKVKEENEKVQLTLVGSGELEHELRTLSVALGLEDSIIWAGNLSRTEIVEIISRHDVTLSSSKLETFGLSIAESLACGTPVVVTDSGGVRDIVGNKDGYITEQSPEAFALGILSMIKNYSIFDAHDIRTRAKERFHEDVIYHQLQQIYNSVIE